jgi:flagellin-like hook-associated protein FlgL
MAINDVSLTAGMRSNLVSLQGTVNLLNRTQERLSSGKKVNSALDNPVNFFTAQAHMSRANSLAGLKDAMGEAVQTIKAADKGISALTTLIEQAKALGQAAKGAAKNQIKIQFSNVTAANTIDIGGATYTAVLSQGPSFDPAAEFVAVSDMNTTVANLAKLINAQDEENDGGGVADMKAVASGSTLILEAKSTTVAITQGNKDDFYDVSGITTAAALTDVDGLNVFSERRALGEQYGEIMSQIDAIASSSVYKGVNLLADEDLNVSFEGSALNVKGFSATASDLGLSTVATTDAYDGAAPTYGASGNGWGWSINVEISADLGKLDVAASTLKSEASKLANNLAIINIQSDFTSNLVNTLTEGSNNLTLADMNEEGANMLMLQTRQSLGTTALSLASQAAQSVLRLFG